MICLSTVPHNFCEVSAYIREADLISFTSPLTGFPLTMRGEMPCLSGSNALPCERQKIVPFVLHGILYIGGDSSSFALLQFAN